MKLFKRVLSTVCALTMVLSLTAFSVVNAESKPEISAKVVDYDPTTGTGKLEISLSNVSDLCGDAGYIDGWQIGLRLDAETFDEELYAAGSGRNNPYKTNEKKMDGPAWIDGTTGEACGTFSPAIYDEAIGGIDVTGSSLMFWEDSDLFYINFTVEDPTKDATIGVTGCIINAKGTDDSELKQVDGEIIAEDVTITGTGSGDDEPELYDENGKVYDEDGDTVFADGANDNAVAYVKSLSGVQGSKVSFAGTFTKANGDTVAMKLKAPKSLDAVIETAGDVVLGLIVQFGAEYTDFALDADSIVIE